MFGGGPFAGVRRAKASLVNSFRPRLDPCASRHFASGGVVASDGRAAVAATRSALPAQSRPAMLITIRMALAMSIQASKARTPLH
jgi:hypothetical protein